MFIRTILLVFLAACGADSATIPESATPDDYDPGDQPIKAPDEEEQHFCCKSVYVDKDKVGHGDGCAPIGKEHIGGCNKVLYCPGLYANDEGAVTCPG